MKKNLNIAYLNGAEGMIRRGGASSGELGGGSNSGDTIKWEYYKVDLEKANNKDLAEEIILTAYSINYYVISANATEKWIHFPTTLMNVANSTHPILSPDGLEIEIKKISGSNLPIQLASELEGETDSLTVDNNSWIENIKTAYDLKDIPFLIPITKEQFYSFE